MAPTIVAHRGLHDVHPENSIAAMSAAWDAGIEWCECDVCEAATGDWVVIHDATLDRTTTGTGPVCSFRVAELARFRLKREDGAVTNEPLPILKDLLHVMRPGSALLLEVKIPGGPLWTNLGQLGNRRIVIQSFYRDVVVEASRFGAATAFLTEKTQDLNDLESLPAQSINIRHDLVDRRVVERCQQAGKRVGVWTVNDPADIRRVIKLGIDHIITDHPLLVREALGNHGR